MTIPTTDFAVFDGEELVSYEPINDPAVDNVRAIRRPLTQSRQRNVERYVSLEATDVIFHLDGAPLAATPLMAGDTLTDANRTYTVIFVERQTLNLVVIAICR
jgi:hypothetical protein